MILNKDCIRDILISLEELPFQETISLNELSAKLSSYAVEEIAYCCIKLFEANYIEANINIPLGKKSISITIYDITFLGHEFLNNIRSDSMWTNVKDIASKIGSTSLSSLSQIATSVITTLIKTHFGL